MLVNVIEFLNAISMVPLLIISIASNNIYTSCLPQILVKYSYIIFTICSMNYHIFRTFNRSNIDGSKKSFSLDASSQHVIIILTSYWSNHPVFNMTLMTIICIFIEFFLDMGKAQHKAFRYMLLIIAIVYIFAYNVFIISFVFLSTLFYIMAKINIFTLGHMMFHLSSTYAVTLFYNDIDKFNQCRNDYIQLSHIGFIISLIYLTFRIPKIYTSCHETIQLINQICHSIWQVMFLLVYASHVYKHNTLYTMENILKFQKDNVIEVYLMYQVGYYISYLIIEKKEFILHHALSIFLIFMAFYTKIHHLAILTLLIFSSSTPFLSFAKLFRSMGKQKAASISFMCFAAVFSIFRVCGLPYIMYISYYGLYNRLNIMYYVTINTLLTSLYIMQLYWTTKIYKILVDNA